MSFNKYTNFVRPTTATTYHNVHAKQLSGDEARNLYLEEIKEAKNNTSMPDLNSRSQKMRTAIKTDIEIKDRDLLLAAQNNDVDTLRQVFNSCPDKINVIDRFGWSLLMIACQANSVDIVQELLLRGADISIRDKAGNSACSLVIKSKNHKLASMLLSHRQETDNNETHSETHVKLKEEYHCETCQKLYPDKDEHLSSTIHNIGASRGKKITAKYVIPPSNIGYQLMLKDGWDRLSGLGPDGSGKRYPIRTVQKIDKKGLGHGKRKNVDKIEKNVKEKFWRLKENDKQSNRKLEINFRRQFY